MLYVKKGETEKAVPLLDEALAWYLEKGETKRVEKLNSQLKNLKGIAPLL